MSLYSKELIKALKEKSKGQRSLKNQRKTINLKGERTIDSSTATYNHRRNKKSLRDLYIVYAKVRGKDLQQTDKNVFEDYTEEGINSMVIKKLENYGKTVCVNP